MVVFRPAKSHIEQTVMRKRIAVFHQQLSPAAPVRLKCAYIAAGHAVAKEVLVSKLELAGKHPQSWFRRLDAAGVDFKLHQYFIYSLYVCQFSEWKGGNYADICSAKGRRIRINSGDVIVSLLSRNNNVSGGIGELQELWTPKPPSSNGISWSPFPPMASALQFKVLKNRHPDLHCKTSHTEIDTWSPLAGTLYLKCWFEWSSLNSKVSKDFHVGTGPSMHFYGLNTSETKQ